MISPIRDFTRIKLNRWQQFLTSEQQRNLPPLYSQDGKGFQAIAHVKFFAGGLTWFATEFDRATGQFFGFVVNHAEPEFSEFGYFAADEMNARQVPSVRPGARPGEFRIIPVVERDTSFDPCPVGEAIRNLTGGKFDPAARAESEAAAEMHDDEAAAVAAFDAAEPSSPAPAPSLPPSPDF